jgi:hypothetical protein
VSTIGTVKGRVLSERGSILGSAEVACDGKKTITLFDGTYEFKNLEPGTYTVTASLKSFKNLSRIATIEKDSKVTVDFHLPEASGNSKISGRVYDVETKKPITSGAVILILPVTNRYVQINNGFYEFDNLAEDRYNLVTSIEGYEDGKAAIAVKENEKKIYDFFCKPVLVIEPSWG